MFGVGRDFIPIHVSSAAAGEIDMVILQIPETLSAKNNTFYYSIRTSLRDTASIEVGTAKMEGVFDAGTMIGLSPGRVLFIKATQPTILFGRLRGAVDFATEDTLSAVLSATEAIGSLVETNNELAHRLNSLAGAMNSGAPALRVIPIASVSTAVTGSVTATVASTVVSSLTNFGTSPAMLMANDINYLAAMTNIEKVTP